MGTRNNEGDYPPGAANDPKAPWNQEKVKYQDVDVTVCVSLSKAIALSLPEDYTEQDMYESLLSSLTRMEIKNLEKNGWIIDDFQIIQE